MTTMMVYMFHVRRTPFDGLGSFAARLEHMLKNLKRKEVNIQLTSHSAALVNLCQKSS